MKHNDWTTEQDTLLLSMREQGMTPAQIAIEFDLHYRPGITKGSILARVHRIKKSGKTIQRDALLDRDVFAKPITPQGDPFTAKWNMPDNAKPTNLMSIKSNQCHWPTWGPNTPFEQKRYCGAPAMSDKPYCSHCHGFLTGPGSKAERAVAKLPDYTRQKTWRPSTNSTYGSSCNPSAYQSLLRKYNRTT